MRLLLCLLCILPAAATTQEVVPFRLYATFQQDPTANVLSALRDELDSLMAPIGWEITWTSLKDATRVSSIALAVVRFKGDCGVNGAVQKSITRRPLGETYVEDGQTLPFSTI